MSDFKTTAECIKELKKSVYSIARGRPLNSEKPNEINWLTIGTGFIVAPNRFITACHVINNAHTSNELQHHKTGDIYYLLRHDDEGKWHCNFFTPELNKSLFLYPIIDLAVIYLQDTFYQHGALKEDFIRIDQNFHLIGSEVAVLGYPLCKIEFTGGDILKPKAENILLRADTGIINCRYQTAADIFNYEFTIAFNPGNSGGPIFDVKTGQLVSIVHGYRTIPINVKENMLTNEQKISLGIKNYKDDSYIDVVHANYSLGYATPSFTKVFQKHNIV
jgi:hypothetical protein